ncbi:MAG: hypothetical protein WCR51_12595 [Planctomycetia bacterium]
MNMWRGFSGWAGCALVVALPAFVLASSFEDGLQVSDRSELFSPAAESVLVDNAGDAVSLDETVGLPTQPRYVASDEQAPASCIEGGYGCLDEVASCDADGADECPHGVGCGDDECLSAALCTDGPCRLRAGWINRILGPADPRWVVQVDALMLWQGNIASRPILLNGAGLTALDVNQAQTVMSAGPRYGLFFNIDQCRAVEGNYFNVGSFTGSEPLPAGTYTPVNMPALFAPPTAASILQTTGQIQSAELNWRRRGCGSPITWLSGFRWVEWNQRLRLVDAAAPTMASIDSQVGNDLYGGQVGMDVSLWEKQGGPITVNGIGKAGAFYNNAFQRTSETAQGGIMRGPESAQVNTTSFFGEVGVNGSVRLTRWLAWRAGYSLFWLSGVAVPANQLSLVSLSATPAPAAINTEGSVLLHGVTTGLEARW